MSQLIQAVRGMNDTLPEQTAAWQALEAILRMLMAQYGYQEIRLPHLEKTELYKRSLGEVTDIVEKEMYTFLDRNGDSLTLRPEGTVGCVRAGLEHGLLYNQIQRWWYMGPMFRHERPQKGRYRQFQQLGVEVFGLSGSAVEAEMIIMSAQLWRTLELDKQLTLQINSLGEANTRAVYRQYLVEYFTQHYEELDADSQRRLYTNPLRILDSKNPALQELINAAPRLLDYLDDTSRQNFAILCEVLTTAGVAYTINPRLVRGLDYYNATVFEWVTTEQAAQNTVCAGGRYDGLVSQLGGQTTPAVGFAIGLERLLALSHLNNMRQGIDAYFIIANQQARPQGILVADQLRRALPTLRLVTDYSGASLKTQFKRADKSGALLALVLAEQELQSGTITVKYLRQEQPQANYSIEQLINHLTQVMSDMKR